jgi:hypothetical protein
MDVIELNMLSGLQNKRAKIARLEAQQAAGMQAIAGRSNQMSAAATSTTNGQPATDAAETSTLGGGPGALVNRSPTTNYHYYPQTTQAAPAPIVTPSPTPPAPSSTPAASSFLPWLAAIPLALGAAGLTYYLTRPAATPVATAPVAPTVPPGWTADPTLKFTDPS